MVARAGTNRNAPKHYVGSPQTSSHQSIPEVCLEVRDSLLGMIVQGDHFYHSFHRMLGSAVCRERFLILRGPREGPPKAEQGAAQARTTGSLTMHSAQRGAVHFGRARMCVCWGGGVGCTQLPWTRLVYTCRECTGQELLCPCP